MAKKQKFKDAEREIYEFISRQKKLCSKIRERITKGNGHLNGHKLNGIEMPILLKKPQKT